MSPYSDGVYEGSWSGTTTAEFTDYTTGLATLSNFVLDSVGLIFFDINVHSNLTDYNLTSEMIIYVYPASHAYLSFPTSVTMTMKFEIDYSTYGNLPFAALVYTYLSKKYPNSQISNIIITEGKIITFSYISFNIGTIRYSVFSASKQNNQYFDWVLIKGDNYL